MIVEHQRLCQLARAVRLAPSVRTSAICDNEQIRWSG
jgi:hypothetical protein